VTLDEVDASRDGGPRPGPQGEAACPRVGGSFGAGRGRRGGPETDLGEEAACQTTGGGGSCSYWTGAMACGVVAPDFGRRVR
jgi:hypothetical protein